MEFDETVVAEAAEYLLAAFHRSKTTGLRWETVDLLDISSEFDNFIRKISIKVRSLAQIVEYGKLHGDQVGVFTPTTCRPQDLLIFDDTSVVVEASQQGSTNELALMSSIEDPSLSELSTKGPELCFPPPNSNPTPNTQLEDNDTYPPTGNTNQRPEEDEQNKMGTASVKEARQLGSDPRSSKTQKRRQSSITPAQHSLRARRKPAVTARLARSVQYCSEFGDLF